MRSKKAQGTSLVVPAILTLALAGLILVFSLIIITETIDETVDTSAATNNETLTTVDEKGELVTGRVHCGFTGLTVVVATNATGGERIESGNYTTDGAYVKSQGKAPFNATNWNVSYTYQYGAGEACEAGNETLVGMGKMADYFDLIVLAIVITVVISLLLIVFTMRKVK